MQASELNILVKNALQGHRPSMDALITAHRQAVFALAMSFLKDRDQAEVAAQEVMIRVFCRLGTLKKPHRFRSWCLTITANYCRDILRARSVPTVAFDSAPEPVAQAQEPALSDQMKEGLARLNPLLSQALLLKDVENFSYQEISQIQQTALGTVKSRIFEARRKLRKWITACPVK